MDEVVEPGEEARGSESELSSLPAETEETMRAQYNEALECWRRQVVTCIQIILGLAAVNATFIGLGIGQQNAWMLLSGAILCGIGYIATKQGEFDVRLSILQAIFCERKLGIFPGLASTWFASSYGLEDFALVKELIDGELSDRSTMDVISARLGLIRKLRPALAVTKFLWIVLIASVVQAGLFLYFGNKWGFGVL